MTTTTTTNSQPITHGAYAYRMMGNLHGGQRAETMIPLGFDRRELKITTQKRGSGGISTHASVVQIGEDGLSFTHVMCTDYSQTIAHDRTARATSAAIERMHVGALAGIAETIEAARKHYRKPAAPTEPEAKAADGAYLLMIDGEQSAGRFDSIEAARAEGQKLCDAEPIPSAWTIEDEHGNVIEPLTRSDGRDLSAQVRDFNAAHA